MPDKPEGPTKDQMASVLPFLSELEGRFTELGFGIATTSFKLTLTASAIGLVTVVGYILGQHPSTELLRKAIHVADILGAHSSYQGYRS